MPTIRKDAGCQTVLTTFETTPGTCEDLLEALQDAYAAFISKQPGFIAAGLHVNDAQTRVCCTNPVRDSSCEFSLVAGMHEQTHTPDLRDQELSGLQ